MNKQKKLLLFGASRGGENFIKNYNEDKLLAIVDNDPTKWGSYFNGLLVISPQQINNYTFDEIIITSQWIDSIKYQLINQIKIPEEKIIINPKNKLKSTAISLPFSHPKTLAVAQECLIKITEFLDKQGIKAILDSGTALGIYREQELLKWDDDIDLAIDASSFTKLISLAADIKAILPTTHKAKWEVEILSINEEDVTLSIFLKAENTDLIEFDLGLQKRTNLDGKSHLVSSAGMFDAPAHHFQTPVKNKYHQGYVYLPNDTEGFLTFMYGNWKEPQQNTSFEDYDNRIKLAEQKKFVIKKREVI